MSESAIRTYKEGRLHAQSRETLRQMTIKSNAITRGTNGFGRQARGREDHGRALVWTIKSPSGETWTFPNLVEWCRKNEDVFPKCHGAKMPTWKRASDGLRVAFRRGVSWYDWTVVSCEEPDNSSSC